MSILESMTAEQLMEFAVENGITFEKACSLRDNAIYREEYRKAYNKRGYVRAKRQEQNRKEYQLRKALKHAAKNA